MEIEDPKLRVKIETPMVRGGTPQRAIDLWEAAKTARRKLERISPLKAAWRLG